MRASLRRHRSRGRDGPLHARVTRSRAPRPPLRRLLQRRSRLRQAPPPLAREATPPQRWKRQGGEARRVPSGANPTSRSARPQRRTPPPREPPLRGRAASAPPPRGDGGQAESSERGGAQGEE